MCLKDLSHRNDFINKKILINNYNPHTYPVVTHLILFYDSEIVTKVKKQVCDRHPGVFHMDAFFRPEQFYPSDQVGLHPE
jgi:hypothetical protein